MSIKHDVIDVSVSQQILWIGPDAYPLKGIVRVGSRKWVPRRWHLVWEFIRSLTGWCLIGFVLAMVIAVLPDVVSHPSVPDSQLLFVLLATGLVVVTAIKAVRLSWLLRFTFYKLDIETAGSSTTALVSRDEAVVRKLAGMITHAINNPAAEFHLKVDNFHLGDNITQHGDRSQVNK